MQSSKRKRIVFGIDDGLPSRVAASILRNQDFDVLAVHLRCDLAAMGEDPATYPSAMRACDLPSIEKFCDSLGVPLKTIDVTGEVLASVYTPFWIATLGGNRFAGSSAWVREVLFPRLDAIAQARGADLLATGHFAQRTPDLFRYPEEAFDQSRTLARLERKFIEKLVLPVGDVSAEMMLRLAREIGATRDAEEFDLARELRTLTEAREKRGKWEWTDEQLADPRVQARAGDGFFNSGPVGGADEVAVGTHRGVPFFQIGSRAPQKPGYFVQEINPQGRMLTVAPEAKLGSDFVIVRELNWNEANPLGSHRKRRVKVEKEGPSRRVPALGPIGAMGSVLEYPGRIGEIRLESPLYALAPGETLVFFEESRVLGAAVVVESSREKPIENASPPA